MKSLGKKLCRGWFITGVILASIFGGCGREVDEEPLLIAPQDATVFDLEPPLFIWHSYPFAEGYVLHISKDDFITGELLVEDTFEDTTYALSDDLFEYAINGEYVWSVAPLIDSDKVGWWEFRIFTIDRPLPQLNFDTTYFPLGLDYQWVYERHVWGAYCNPTYPEPEEWDYYKTITIEVTDSMVGDDGWVFYVNEAFQDGTPFHNQGDTIHIFRTQILVFGNYKIPLLPQATGPKQTNEGLEVIYEKDTLCLVLKEWYSYGPVSDQTYIRSTSRLKDVGVIRQFYEDSYSGHCCGGEQNIEDRLLYFIKGADTVWRADKQP